MNLDGFQMDLSIDPWKGVKGRVLSLLMTYRVSKGVKGCQRNYMKQFS